jgi:hypothetical protein
MVGRRLSLTRFSPLFAYHFLHSLPEFTLETDTMLVGGCLTLLPSNYDHNLSRVLRVGYDKRGRGFVVHNKLSTSDNLLENIVGFEGSVQFKFLDEQSYSHFHKDILDESILKQRYVIGKGGVFRFGIKEDEGIRQVANIELDGRNQSPRCSKIIFYMPDVEYANGEGDRLAEWFKEFRFKGQEVVRKSLLPLISDGYQFKKQSSN